MEQSEISINELKDIIETQYIRPLTEKINYVYTIKIENDSIIIDFGGHNKDLIIPVDFLTALKNTCSYNGYNQVKLKQAGWLNCKLGLLRLFLIISK